MKRTVTAAALALGVSTPSFALMMPAAQTKVVCLDSFEDDKGIKYAGSCDQAANNVETGATLLVNGCAEGQIAVTSVGYPVPAKKKGQKEEIKFNVEVENCLPPNVAQL